MRGLGSGVQGLGRVVGARVGTKGGPRSGVRAQGVSEAGGPARDQLGSAAVWGKGAEGLGAESGGGGG